MVAETEHDAVVASTMSDSCTLQRLDEEAQDLWKQAETAFQLHSQENAHEDTAQPLDESDDPSLHVCPGSSCRFCVATVDGMTCTVSGFTFQRFAKHDPVAAGNVHSMDDNGVLSSQAAAPHYKHGRSTSAHKASTSASIAAHQLGNTEEDDEEFIKYGIAQEKTQTLRLADARAHRDPLNVNRRCRTSKRDITRVSLAALVDESKHMFDHLMAAGDPSASRGCGVRGQRVVLYRRKRMHSDLSPYIDGAGRETINRYVADCRARGVHVDMSKIHEMVVAYDNQVVRDARHRLVREEFDARTKWYTTVREHICKLAVCLWQSAVNSPYMSTGKHTNDNFRPFVAGIFFSIKRGVTLPNGAVIVPKCLAISSVLPSTRITHQHGPTHQIHLSSHKGVCTLHKAVHSVPDVARDRFFKDVVDIARVLYDLDRLKSR